MSTYLMDNATFDVIPQFTLTDLVQSLSSKAAEPYLDVPVSCFSVGGLRDSRHAAARLILPKVDSDSEK
jgi:hypothetical protein